MLGKGSEVTRNPKVLKFEGDRFMFLRLLLGKKLNIKKINQANLGRTREL